ncbi:MAG: L-serine ammonia-lyase [Planctomycetes bacterium]|nr:L-serine ammonia-lyase [Planctomycetota bacterium]
MSISIFDLFTIGIGPSSSHTVGPMRAGLRFARELETSGRLPSAARVEAQLFGSLGLTGRGHGTDWALLLGLEGETPESVDPEDVLERFRSIRDARRLNLLGVRAIPFQPDSDILFHRMESLPLHPNGIRIAAYAATGAKLLAREYYSIGGGFVVDEETARQDRLVHPAPDDPLPFRTAQELLEIAQAERLSIGEIVLRNEAARSPESEVRRRLLEIWRVMEDCVRRGCRAEGILPGKLHLRRRAPALFAILTSRPEDSLRDPLTILDWIDLYALAVSEENAAGGRVVTAPTNGAAGIVPAVLHYYQRFRTGATDEGVVRFLLCAGAIGILYKENASISGAEVGCQGEIGVACSMAAAGLTEALGGTPLQVENAAEIGMEHHLGLTCDPVGGLVQIPCIERNAVGAVSAVNAARIALRGDGKHFVSLDRVIATMKQTGADMMSKYKETSRGGLAVNVSEC